MLRPPKVAGGTRTHDSRNHNPVLFLLSYCHSTGGWNRTSVVRLMRPKVELTPHPGRN